MDTFAAIDIGTNTILLLIARKIDAGNFKILREEHSVARLGEGIGGKSEIKRISPAAAERAEKILAKYKSICDEHGVSRLKVAGTSALRDAANQEEVKERLSKAIGEKIRVISGNEEARLSYLGAVEDGGDNLVIDIGGGSVEVIVGEGSEVIDRVSLQIGAVRLKENVLASQPCQESHITRAREIINESLAEVDFKFERPTIYAVAGTPTTLAAIAQNLKEYDRDKVHGYILQIGKIEEIFDVLKSMSAEDIAREYNLHPFRADVITSGTLILLETLRRFGAESCKVSANGLRTGVIKSMIK